MAEPARGQGLLGGVVAFFVRHPTAANLLMALMLLAGVAGLLRLNTQFFPTLEVKLITVSVPYPGATAEDVENTILDAVEPEVRFVQGVDEVSSYAREGSASIRLTFDERADMEQALAEVEQAVAGVDLPEGAERPVVSRVAFFDDVAKLAVTGPFEEAALKRYARQLRDRLIAEGIDKVSFNGLRDTEYLIEPSAEDLRRLGLTPGDVAARLGENTADQPSGGIDGTVERQVRTLGRGEGVQDLSRVEVISLASGERVLLRDLAAVRAAPADGEPRGLANGRPAIELVVERSPGQDTLEADERMDAALRAFLDQAPASLEVLQYESRADPVGQRIGLLFKNGLTGLAVVLVVLFLFLGAGVAFWVAAGIPVALMATFGFMLFSGQTINMMSLFALIMTLGIIVDDAIVVGEHTATRLSLGDDPATAAVNGAGQMLMPVMAAMLTTAATFLPILLITGTIGQIMTALPLVTAAVLVASLVECFLILPAHLAHGLGSGKGGAARFSWPRVAIVGAAVALALAPLAQNPGLLAGFGVSVPEGVALPALAATAAVVALALLLGVGVERLRARRAAKPKTGPSAYQRFRNGFDGGFATFRERAVRPLVGLAVSWRYVTLALCASALILAGGLVRSGQVGFVFFPSPEAENIRASVSFSPGLPEAEAIAALERVEQALYDAERELTGGSGDRLIAAVFSTYGQSGRSVGDNVASVDVELTASERRTIRTPEIVEAWREAVPLMPGVQRVAAYQRRGGPPGRDVDVRLKDAPTANLKAAALEVAAALEALPGVSGVDDDLPFGKPELVLELTPRGAAMGFTTESVARQVRESIEGSIARRIPASDEEIVVRVRRAMEGSGGELRAMELKSPEGMFVPLEEVAELSERRGFSVIQREDGRTVVAVTADIDQDLTSNQEVLGALEAGQLPAIAARYGVAYEFAGRAEETDEAFADLTLGAYVALATMYIILAWLFGSYARPFAVLLIIPFGVVGAILGHWVMGFPLTILSVIGLLGLAGILVNDSIILVVRYSERLAMGEGVRDAAANAAADRLRAVLLTSLSTVGGLTPLLFESSVQAQFLKPMAITIVFGLGVATLFVLFLVPALLSVGEDLRRAAAYLGYARGSALRAER